MISEKENEVINNLLRALDELKEVTDSDDFVGVINDFMQLINNYRDENE